MHRVHGIRFPTVSTSKTIPAVLLGKKSYDLSFGERNKILNNLYRGQVKLSSALGIYELIWLKIILDDS